MDFSNLGEYLKNLDLRTITAVLALIISLFALYISNRNSKLALSYSKNKDSLEKQQKLKQQEIDIRLNLDKAWLLLGGKLDSEAIVNFAPREKLNEAKKIIESCLLMDENNSECYRLMGLYYDGCKLPVKAEQWFLKSLELSNDNKHLIFNNLGCLELESGNYDKANAYFEKSISKKDDYKFGYHNLGYLEYLRKNYDTAETFLKKSIDLDPEYPMAFINLGNVYFKQKMYEKSEIYYLKALNIDSNNPNSLLNLGILNLRIGKKEKSLSYFVRAIDIDSKLIKAYRFASSILGELGRIEEANNYLQKSIILQSTLPEHLDSVLNNLFISVDISAFSFAEDVMVIAIDSCNTASDLFDRVYKRISKKVKPYEYGFSWQLKIKDSSVPIESMGMKANMQKGKGYPDLRKLWEIKINGGEELIAFRLKSHV